MISQAREPNLLSDSIHRYFTYIYIERGGGEREREKERKGRDEQSDKANRDIVIIRELATPVYNNTPKIWATEFWKRNPSHTKKVSCV